MEKYNLTQTGQEVQDILNNATPHSELTTEVERAQEAERVLGEGVQQNADDIDAIEAKIPSAASSENKLTDKEYVDGQVDNEKTRAQGAEDTLQDNIDAEELRAKTAEEANANDIDAIEAKIPSGASSENKLATESYVNDAVSTASATFRGTFNLVSDLHLTLEATHANIATALDAAIATADNNDFAFVLVPTDEETPTVIGSIDRYKFNGEVWAYEYTLNNSGFTQEQWDAINSGITSGDVTKLGALPTNAELTLLLNGLAGDIGDEETRAKAAELALQEAIGDEETRAKAAEKANADDIDAIEEKIPSSASSSNKLATASDVDNLSAAIEAILLLIPSAATQLNQLADKAFVNSSISTATATFRGTFNLVSDLHLTLVATRAQIETALGGAIPVADNSDYCFVQIPTSADTPTEIAKTERYKFNGSEWAYEYDLNNSGYTAVQWAAINSGITQALVSKLSALPTNADLTTALGVLTTGIETINEKIPTAASISNKMVDTAAMVSYVTQIIEALDMTFNVTSEGGHVTLQIRQEDGAIVSVAVSTTDIASELALNVVRDRVTAAEGNIITLTGRVSINERDIALLQDAYAALTQSEPVIIQKTDTWPVAHPETKVIYRVVDRVNTPPQYYSDYMWNGTTMVLMATYNNAIDDVPTSGSNNLVKSGGVFNELALGAVYDVTAHNSGATFASLEALLTDENLSTLIPTAVRKGGMSIKFVQSSDHKYVQYRLMADSWSTDTEDWAIADEGVYVDNPEYVYVKTDAEGKILWAIKTDGGIYYGAGVPQQVIDYVEEKIAELSLDEYEDIVSFLTDYLGSDTTLKAIIDRINAAKVDKVEGKSLIDAEYADGVSQIENPEFAEVHTDKDDKILYGVKQDGDFYFGTGIPSQIQEELDDLAALAALAENKVDKEEGKSLIDEGVADSLSTIEDPEGRHEVTTDSESRIISYRKPDGTKVENVGIESPKIATDSLNLSESGMTEFQQALKESGFQPGGGGDWSEREVIELPEPASYSLLNLIVDSLPVENSDVSEGYAEYYDKAGNYFKLPVSLEAQGQSSRIFARTGGKGNYTADFPTDIKFGSWVPQDSFHLKGCAKDVVRGILPTSYKWAYMFMEYLDAKPNRVLLKDNSEITTTHASGDRFTDWGDGARCLPDGFPVEVYINGEYWGLYSWQLKKHRKNYSMDKKDYSSCFIDADEIMTSSYTHGIWNDGPDDRTYRASSWWTGFDIKGPKDLICMDGSKFDGDHPEELIDNTSEYYDDSNKAHKGSAQTKAIIRAFQTKYLEVKTLIDNNDIDGAKAKFNDNFDYNACMLVYIFNCLMKNGDSIKKNTLWGTYKDGKVFPALWDLDSMYGQGWVGNSVVSPTTSTWNAYANAAWPLGLFWTLYNNEIRQTYNELRSNKILSIDTWRKIVREWVDRIGVDAYDRDIEKWPETPSYRKNLTNTDYWTEVGTTLNVNTHTIWNENDTYTAGSMVALRSYPGNNNGMIYSAKVDNVGVCPVTDFYEKFPQIGGFFDSPKRWEKWMVEQIELCDNFMGYTE